MSKRTSELAEHFERANAALGIPCVVGTLVGTQRLRDGQVVTVDGRWESLG